MQLSLSLSLTLELISLSVVRRRQLCPTILSLFDEDTERDMVRITHNYAVSNIAHSNSGMQVKGHLHPFFFNCTATVNVFIYKCISVHTRISSFLCREAHSAHFMKGLVDCISIVITVGRLIILMLGTAFVLFTRGCPLFREFVTESCILLLYIVPCSSLNTYICMYINLEIEQLHVHVSRLLVHGTHHILICRMMNKLV